MQNRKARRPLSLALSTECSYAESCCAADPWKSWISVGFPYQFDSSFDLGNTVFTCRCISSTESVIDPDSAENRHQ